jgi:hypothetical protein
VVENYIKEKADGECFGSRSLEEDFGCRREEVTGGWGKFVMRSSIMHAVHLSVLEI